ncbi:Translocation protein S66 [Polyrhizophydium stewartii]|uniref:Translocation protein S66 n=1 Tax=Polyrhizophydium stewartii TaxID=2732419 RepID=A0ABR4N0C8_9FUNG|nr:translocation protein S66 [Polyrhizophydium stewartii]
MAHSSLWLPLVYVTSLAVLFALFARYNKGRQLQHNQSSSYFPLHTAKYEYEELAEQFSPEDPFGQMVLISSLMKRAVEDVRRVLKIREEKPPLQQMVRDGIVGEELFDRIVRAEQELEAELQMVMEDAEMYREGWGKTIFQEASQIAQQQIQQIWQAQAQARLEEKMLEEEMLKQHGQTKTPGGEGHDAKHTHDHDHGHSHDHSHDHGHGANRKTPASSQKAEPKAADKENVSPADEIDEDERKLIEEQLLLEEEREHQKLEDSAAKSKSKATGKRKKKH